MSTINKLLRNSQKVRGTQKQIARNSGAVYAPGASDEFVQKWMHTLASKATTAEGRTYCAQLSSLIAYYNRIANKDIETINWDEWKSQIQTRGLVEKVQENHAALTSQEYDTKAVADRVLAAPSKELEELDNELIFHGAVWLNCYSDYTMFLWELEEYGDPNDYLMHENYDFFQGLEAELEELTETHNYIAGSKDDINLRGYISCQFGWGKKVVSFYRHPADDFKCGKATKNILGR